jgi:hypothetical protein
VKKISFGLLELEMVEMEFFEKNGLGPLGVNSPKLYSMVESQKINLKINSCNLH